MTIQEGISFVLDLVPLLRDLNMKTEKEKCHLVPSKLAAD